jgi:hypothetical protein
MNYHDFPRGLSLEDIQSERLKLQQSYEDNATRRHEEIKAEMRKDRIRSLVQVVVVSVLVGLATGFASVFIGSLFNGK